MTITFATEAPSSTHRLFGTMARLADELSAWRVKRAQRLALASLLELSPARLDDLGINHQDVAEALYSGGPRPLRVRD